MKAFYTKPKIKLTCSLSIVFIVLSIQFSIFSQDNRVHYNNKDIFLSGINVAWVNFASDLGPNPPDLDQFREEFQAVRDNGGNAVRFWMFTNGSQTPVYNSNGFVTGPGPVAVRNLKEILDLAHHYNIGLILCLWSFDMLRTTELDSVRLAANEKMLTDTSYTRAFIKNALVPMVDSVKGDSAIIAWEVCNEPNGMTTGTNYYPADPTVPGSAIRQFTNLIAGAIHKTDPKAMVTTGPGSFQTLTDVNPIAKATAMQNISLLSSSELQNIADGFNAAHRMNLTSQQMKDYLLKVTAIPDTNYYRDDRLIAAGKDSMGTLDFYTVHYYSYGSTALSPFTHPFSYWGLTKPTAIGEFYMTTTDGAPDNSLFPDLYQNGYAGALVWSWTDFPNTPNNAANAANDTWSALQFMKSSYQQDVDPLNTNYPLVSIISPHDSSSIKDSTQLTITAAVKDTGASISYVQFFSNDSLIGTVNTPFKTSSDTLFYSFDWKNINTGNYVLSAITENSKGQQEISGAVRVTFGTAAVTKLEAEKAIVHGTGIATKNDPTASGGAYCDITTNDTTVTITWQFVNSSDSGSYPVSFGYKLAYGTPKEQFINVNGIRADTITFDGTGSSWLEKTITVKLLHGTNSVQMEIWWGWMYLDYMAVPSSIITSISNTQEIPLTFALQQNYPNPFNPSTNIEFSIAKSGLVNLSIYNILGQRVAVLIDRQMTSGNYNIRFDGMNLSSGVYLYVLRSGSTVLSKKMLLLK
jgi:Secretion system C-terminal sorting domain/Bacterial Ig domain/Carbohydrate binding module (family 35)/Cellulase (glycosyl hydrolase family 5)